VSARFYRRFQNNDNDITRLPPNHPDGPGWRLASSLFLSERVSVDNAELTSPEETAARAPGGVPSGVAEVEASVIAEIGASVVPDPTPENHAHCLILGMDKQKRARKLARSAKIVLPLPGLRVVGRCD